MPDYDVVDLSTLEETDWLNGKGRTRHIAAQPAAGSPGFLWRLSQAELEHDAEFSAFYGVERIFTLLTAGPLALTIEGSAHTVRRGEPQEFPGEANVTMTLGRGPPQKALNVMVARGRARGAVHLHPQPVDLSQYQDGLVAIAVISGELRLQDGRAVGPLHVLIPGEGAAIADAREATVATIHVTPVGEG